MHVYQQTPFSAVSHTKTLMPSRFMFSQALWSISSSANNAAQAVPEPTSGLLVLLGAAVLALRRKRI